MKIYVAAFHTSARRSNNASDKAAEATQDLVYPYFLESYHYLRQQHVDVIRERGYRVFLDSGAFSMFTQGVDVDLPAYAEFVKTNADILETYSNLDHIGRGGEQKTWDNQKTLERLGCMCQPVFHARDDDKWLERYLAEGYDYIFLGGMVPETKGYLLGWLDHVWDKYLTNRDGTAKVKIHGFGMTTADIMFRYPWYSVDSTSWAIMAAVGSIVIDMPHQDFIVSVSSDSPTAKQMGRHIRTLPRAQQTAVNNRIKELGFDPEQLAVNYGWRFNFNIKYYERAMARAVTTFKRQSIDLFA